MSQRIEQHFKTVIPRSSLPMMDCCEAFSLQRFLFCFIFVNVLIRAYVFPDVSHLLIFIFECLVVELKCRRILLRHSPFIRYGVKLTFFFIIVVEIISLLFKYSPFNRKIIENYNFINV